jgi:hypothetical protein
LHHEKKKIAWCYIILILSSFMLFRALVPPKDHSYTEVMDSLAVHRLHVIAPPVGGAKSGVSSGPKSPKKTKKAKKVKEPSKAKKKAK